MGFALTSFPRTKTSKSTILKLSGWLNFWLSQYINTLGMWTTSPLTKSHLCFISVLAPDDIWGLLFRNLSYWEVLVSGGLVRRGYWNIEGRTSEISSSVFQTFRWNRYFSSWKFLSQIHFCLVLWHSSYNMIVIFAFIYCLLNVCCCINSLFIIHVSKNPSDLLKYIVTNYNNQINFNIQSAWAFSIFISFEEKYSYFFIF